MAVILRSSQRVAKFQIQIKISENALLKNVACFIIRDQWTSTKWWKINPEAIAARTCKYVGLCSALVDLTNPCWATQSSQDKPVIKGLQEPLPPG